MFRCLLCDKVFNKYYKVKNHLLETHSGVGYYCPVCTKDFTRRMAHVKCPAKAPELIYYHKQSGKKGKAAEDILTHFRYQEVPSHWEEMSKSAWEKLQNTKPAEEFQLPVAISPLREDPMKRKSPLERVDPGKASLSFSRKLDRKRSGKATATVTSAEAAAKKPRSESPDLSKDPVDILDNGLPMEFQPLEPNREWVGVTFDPPTKVYPSLNLSDTSSDDDDDFEEVCDSSTVINLPDIMAVKEPKTDNNNNNSQTEDKNYRDRVKSTIQKVEELARKSKSEGPVTHNSKHSESKETVKSKTTKNMETNTTSKSASKSTTQNKDCDRTLKTQQNSKSVPQTKDSDSKPTPQNKDSDKTPKTLASSNSTSQNKDSDKTPKTEPSSKSTSQNKDCDRTLKTKQNPKSVPQTKDNEKRINTSKSQTKDSEKTIGTTKPKNKDNEKTFKTCTGKKGKINATTTDTRRVNLKIQCPRIPTSPGLEVLPGHIQLSQASRMDTDQLTVTIPGSLDYGNPGLDSTTTEDQMRLGPNTPDEQRPQPGSVPKSLSSTEKIPPFKMDEDDCRNFIADNVRLRHPSSTTFRKAIPRPIDMPENLAEELCNNILRHLQRSQEEQIILRIGERDFCTSRVTLRADHDSLFTAMLRDDSPFRPYGRNMYYIDRDGSHFRHILNYLRNGAHIDAEVLPDDRRTLLELLTEARFYMCQRLQEIICKKLEQVTGSKDQF